MKKTFLTKVAASLVLVLLQATVVASAQSLPSLSAGPVSITASAETEPVPHSRDAADDPLIYIHPTDPSLSMIMGNDKHGAYEVYDLTGRRLQSLPYDVANTDIRYNFPLGGRKVTLVVGFSSTKRGMIAWKVDPTTRKLEDVTAPGVQVQSPGGALYYSKPTGQYYWFSNNKGTLYQYRLHDDGSGRVTATLVRTYAYGSGESEGIVADDMLGFVYVAEETIGLWKIPAEPSARNEKILVDQPVDGGGHFHPDLEGLTIYYKPDGTGYLIASSQGNNSYLVYAREGSNRFLGAFTIQDGVVDGTSSTDGIDVTNFPLGAAFPHGLFVAQDGQNLNNGVRVNQNFKLVPFERIAAPLNLEMDSSWDPRAVGR